MKKILPMLLVLSMLVAGCLLLSSCSGVTEAKAEKDPVDAIGSAMDNAFTSFFEEEKDLAAINKKAADKGSLNIVLATDMLPDGKLYELNETLYLDLKGSNVVSETKLTIAGTSYRASIFGNKESLALKSESILGTKDTFKITFDRFLAEFKDSDLAKSLNLDAETADEILKIAETITKAFDEKDPIIPKKDMEKLTKEMLEILKQEIKSETLTVDGKEVTCVVMTYSINNENFAELVEFYLQLLKDYDLLSMFGEVEMDMEIDEMLGTIVDDLNETAELDMSLALYINGKTGGLVQANLDINIEPIADPDLPAEYASDPVEISLALTVSEKKMVLEGDIYADGEEAQLTVEIAKAKKDDKISYTFTAGMRQGNVHIDFLDATYAYDKKTGDITFDGFIAVDQSDRISFELKGLCEIKDDSYTISLKSFAVMNGKEELFNFKTDRNNELSVTVSAVKEIPAVSEDAIDIMDMDEKAWSEFVENIQKSELGQLIIGGGNQATPEPDYDYDYDYDYSDEAA